MILTLDHTQRLNLHALLGAQRGDVATIRALWTLQDKIALIPDEETGIELKREVVSGQERVVWNPILSVPTRDFEVSETELAHLKSAIETWNGYAASSDRRWLEPLLGAIVCADPGNPTAPPSQAPPPYRAG